MGNTDHLQTYARGTTPQTEPIRDDQVENSAGGFVWKVDDWTKARRFLILGAEGGTYYVGEREFVRSAAKAVERCLAEDGPRMVSMIREVSDRGLAVKNDPALFALALATVDDNERTRTEAWSSLTTVARTGTHILHFASFRDSLGGWGRKARRGMARWYDGVAGSLAYQLIKYRQRDGWSHRDILRLAHPRASSRDHAMLFEFITGNASRNGPLQPEPPEGEKPTEAGWSSRAVELVEGFERAQRSTSPRESAKLIEQYDLPREAILTDHLPSKEVQEALLVKMPATALIRNLANLTRSGVVGPMNDGSRLVVEKLANTERLRKARVHPVSILSALRVYSKGQPIRGRGEPWEPVVQVVDALDAAFYEAFENVESAGKRTLLAIDVSGSMTHHEIAGIAGLNCREGAAAMAMVTAATEPEYHAITFSGPYVEDGSGWGRAPTSVKSYAQAEALEKPESFPISKRERIDDVIERMKHVPFGRTDCSVPMTHALEQGIDVDTFVIYTDNETFAGERHPKEALDEYRRKTGIPARLVVVSMTAEDFTIADPTDAGMLDVVGFDASTPATIAAFSRGEV